MAEREDIAAVLVRMPAEILTRIDAYRKQVRQQTGGDTTRNSLIVHAITRWLESLGHTQAPEVSTPPICIEAPVETPRVAVSAQTGPAPLLLPTSSKALPANLDAIAETAAQYDKLSLRALAQKLYDLEVHRSRDSKTGAAKPVNPGTLKKWLDQARETGLL